MISAPQDNMQYAGAVMTLHLVVTSLSQSSHHKKSHHFHKVTEVTEVTGPITITRSYCSTRDGHLQPAKLDEIGSCHLQVQVAVGRAQSARSIEKFVLQ